MNPIKKILVKYRKTRGVYDEINKVYRNKFTYDPEKKNEIRLHRRMKQLGIYDFDECEEPPIENLTAGRAKLVQKMITDVRNNNRLSRPQMPLELKQEYIKRCKEFSLWSTNKWRHMRHTTYAGMDNINEMSKSIVLLPMELVAEVIDFEGYNDMAPAEDDEEPKIIHEELSEGKERFEYSENILYTPQLLRIYPDDMHIRTKVLLNMKTYLDKGANKGEDEEDKKTNQD